MAINNAVNAKVQGYQSLNITTGVWNGRTFTAGAGISITNGDGTAGNTVISSTSTAVFSWSDQAVSFSATAENGYMSTAAAVVATLPAAGQPNGTTIAFMATTTDVFKIQPLTTDKISLSSSTSTNGTGSGFIQSTALGDSVELVYQSSSGTWRALDCVGNWTIN